MNVNMTSLSSTSTETPPGFGARPPHPEPFSVAQVSNLLYRRFPIGRAGDSSSAPRSSDDSQAGSPAIHQVGNLRYSTSGPINDYQSAFWACAIRSHAWGRFLPKRQGTGAVQNAGRPTVAHLKSWSSALGILLLIAGNLSLSAQIPPAPETPGQT